MKLIELGDAYVVLPGATGTLVELATAWEYRNKGLIKRKPIVVLGDFWNPVLERVEEMLKWEGSETASRHVRVVNSSEECVRVIREELG